MVVSTTTRSIPAATRRVVRLVLKMLPALVLAGGITLSWYLAGVMRAEIERTAEERFVHQLDLVKKRVVERLAHLTLISELGLGMVQIVNNTNPDQWTSFTNGLDWKSLTGLIGIGYAERAKPYAASLLTRLYTYSSDISIESLGDPQSDRIYPVTLFEPASRGAELPRPRSCLRPAPAPGRRSRDDQRSHHALEGAAKGYRRDRRLRFRAGTGLYAGQPAEVGR